MPELRIGCSGFSYKHWKEVFYPVGLPERKWLEYYSTIFSTVELNVTFYHLPSHNAFSSWYSDTPSHFQFAVKGSRYITHIKRLTDCREPLKKFFEGASLLKEKLVVVLWQLPPAFKMNRERLASFFTLLDHYPVRHTFEFRHESWLDPEIVALCREHNIGLCTADSPPYLDELPITSDFVYIRRHGHGAKYASRYSKDQIAHDASRIKSFHKQGKDVFIYFNNDAHGYAPANGQELIVLLR